MGILELFSHVKSPRLDFELVGGCDHRCGHCYNVWNAEPDDPAGAYETGHLPTTEYLAMMSRAVKSSGAEHITITGGEPLLRKDALEIIEHACSLVPTVQLITNGSHVDEAAAARLARAGVRSVQLTLLSADRAQHDALKGAECFDDTVAAAARLRRHGVPVTVCFVAMHENWGAFEDVFALCFALGVESIAYNRMSPTGWAIHEIDRLLPLVEQVEANLEVAERLGPRWGIRVSTAMPIPPCLIDPSRYRWVKFGFCSTGTDSPNITVDPIGNVRSCNLSSHVMGNVTEDRWSRILADSYYQQFRSIVPERCRGCTHERTCNGGCKESARATYGRLDHPEPFVHLAVNGDRARRLRVLG